MAKYQTDSNPEKDSRKNPENSQTDKISNAGRDLKKPVISRDVKQTPSVIVRKKPAAPVVVSKKTPSDGSARQTAAALDGVWKDAENNLNNNLNNNAETGQENNKNNNLDRIILKLARRYHDAIMARLRESSKRKPFRKSQISAHLNDFLSIKKHCESAKIPVILRRFVKTGAFLESRPEDDLTKRVRRDYAEILIAAARQSVTDFVTAQPEADLLAMLTRKDFPIEILFRRGISQIWSVWYIPQAIRTSLSLLVALNPKDEYPEARAMRRHFILHIGGTNTGKTYEGLQRLIRAPTGVYLGPLRLLAMEAQDALLDAGIKCGLVTGEEEDLLDDDTHIAATAEKLNLKKYYDAAVIDECQMIADRQRGYAWTRAILGIQCPEIHLCAAPQAKNLLTRLIDSCGDTFEVQFHERKTPLICMNRVTDFQHIQPGDALITFSKIGVLSIAEDLRQDGKEPAIIYGALPYATRRKQMEGFLEGRMQYVVATDAIGMGLNLPIRRVIFMDTEKFDGIERRELKPEEIQQIAGRAGRFGMYNQGYVGATHKLAVIRAGLLTRVPPLQYAIAGFSDLVLQVDFDLLEVLTEWNRLPTVDPYMKLDISRYIFIISKMREMGFFLTKEQELRAANIPFDEDEEPLRDLFFQFLRRHQRGENIEQPGYPEIRTLPELELYYRKLDLYFSFAKAFDCPVDHDKLYDAREAVADEINEILLHKLKNNIKFCSKCGKALPPSHYGGLCADCYQKEREQYQNYYIRRRK